MEGSSKEKNRCGAHSFEGRQAYLLPSGEDWRGPEGMEGHDPRVMETGGAWRSRIGG